MARNPERKEEPELEVYNRELGTLVELDSASLDPNFQYRWVNRAPQKVARAKARGYIVVDPSKEEIKNLVGESPEASDGTYTIGDVILMKLLKSDFRARKKAVKRKTDKRLKSPVRRFRRAAREGGLREGRDIEVISKKDPHPDRED